MNKKIIAIAIASALTAPAAMADMSITGQLGAAFVSSDKNFSGIPTASTAGKSIDPTKSYRGMQDSGLSKLDFKGTAGNAFTHIGMDIRNLMGGQTLAGRDLYLGYKFNSGALSFGRMPSAMTGIEGDKYNATFMELRRTAGVAALPNKDKTLTDSFTYGPIVQWAMKVGDANVKIQYDPADNSQGSNTKGYTAVSVKGKAGPVDYFAGYNNGTGDYVTDAAGGIAATTGNKDSYIKAGAAMKFGMAKVTLVITQADNNGTKDDGKALLADFDMGAGMSVGAGYGTNKAKDTWMRLGVTKNLDKAVKVFGGVVNKKPNGGSAGTAIGVGMAIKF